MGEKMKFKFVGMEKQSRNDAGPFDLIFMMFASLLKSDAFSFGAKVPTTTNRRKIADTILQKQKSNENS